MRRAALSFVLGAGSLFALAACSLAFDGSEYADGKSPTVIMSKGGLEGGAAMDGEVADAPADADARDGTTAAPCKSAGDMCPDGTVLAGTSTKDGRPLYTTPCDLGLTLVTGSCSGSRTAQPFNDGNGQGGVFIGATSSEDGALNTAMLAAADSNSALPGKQPHRAAQACVDLRFAGASDWYLPALDELRVLFKARALIKNFLAVAVFYKSSTETHNAAEPLNAARIQFSDGYEYADGDSKPVVEPVRCIRKGPP